MTSCFVVDTWAWIAYFDKNPSYRQLIEESMLKTPTVVVAELSRILERRKASESAVSQIFSFVEKRSEIMPLDAEKARTGGKLAEKEELDFADALIYNYASQDQLLLTGDEHFRGKKNALLIK